MEPVPSALEGEVLPLDHQGRPCTQVSIALDLCPAPPPPPWSFRESQLSAFQGRPSSLNQSVGIWWTVCPKSGTGLKSQDPGPQSEEGRKGRKAGNLQPSGKNKMPSAPALMAGVGVGGCAWSSAGVQIPEAQFTAPPLAFSSLWTEPSRSSFIAWLTPPHPSGPGETSPPPVDLPARG